MRANVVPQPPTRHPSRPLSRPLSRQDLIEMEPLLADDLASAVAFNGFGLLFPKHAPDNPDWDALHAGHAVYLRDEQRLLLPLVQDGELLAVVAARGVRLAAPRSEPRLLARLAALALDKLRLAKAAATDTLTGLVNAERLAALLADEVRTVRHGLLPGFEPRSDAGPGEYTACFGLVLARLDNLEAIRARRGLAAGDAALLAAAAAVRDLAPEGAVAARQGEDALALFLPGATAATCRSLARSLAKALSLAHMADPMLEQRVAVQASLGFASYPQDVTGQALQLHAAEQAAILTRRATQAATVAFEHGKAQVFGFGRILAEGGFVRETLPMSRLTVSLGSGVGAMEGQRFLVWSAPETHGNGPDTAVFKGEIILMECREEGSLAEAMYVNDPAFPMAVGDRLTLVREAGNAPPATGGDAGPTTGLDGLTGLLRYRDFLERFAHLRETHQRFTVALVRLPERAEDRAAHLSEGAEGRIRAAAAAATEIFGPTAVGGRYSLGGLAFFLPDATGKQARGLALKLAVRLSSGDPGNGRPAIGLAPHPFLSFAKSDALDNARKALEYARLLPEPHVGLLDTLALTIHADALFSQGRIFDAIEEYKLALLADRANLLARNSLGVCLSRLGRHGEAKRQFKAVADRDPKDLSARYNYGHTCLRMGQSTQARQAFRTCLRLDPDHIFSLVRLGQIAQEERRFSHAKGYLDKAAKAGGDGMVRRHQARLALARNRTDQAREHLHQALLHDPRDAESLHLMARLYLESGEDSEVAEALARQAAAIRPERPAYWLGLADALEAQGKAREARDARARAEQAARPPKG